MIVTINTDASFSHEYQKGAFAFWIICNQGKFSHSGLLRRKCINSHMAEMKAIVNALHQLGVMGYQFITKIIINTDSMNSIALIKNGELPTHAKGDGLGFGFRRACFVAKV